jgi:hypothetical protein
VATIKEQIQQIIDEFPIELFDPTTPEQDEALQEWFGKLKTVRFEL